MLGYGGIALKLGGTLRRGFLDWLGRHANKCAMCPGEERIPNEADDELKEISLSWIVKFQIITYHLFTPAFNFVLQRTRFLLSKTIQYDDNA